MKIAFLSLLALAPLSAFAAPAYVCSVTVPSQPRQFDKELVTLDLTKETEARFVLLSKDQLGAAEIPEASWQARKNEKRMADIDGQAVAVFQTGEDNLVYVTFGYVSAAENKLVNGGSALSYPVSKMIANFPLDMTFAVGCRVKD